MGLPENILLALFDKLLIGLLLAVVGLWINRNLEQIKAYLALRNVIAPLRATSYGSLWKVTEKLTPRDSLVFSGNQKSVVLNELRDWYYEKGNAMYLSLDAADLYLNGLKLVEAELPDTDTIKKTFSKLPTQLKVDIGVYTVAEANIQIPRPLSNRRRGSWADDCVNRIRAQVNSVEKDY